MKKTKESASAQFEGSDVLVKAIDCIDAKECSSFRILSRGGRILCALPPHKVTALKTLSLYQPQKLKGQIFKQGIRASINFDIPSPFLKRWNTGLASDHGQRDGIAGFIIGSRGHLCDRAVAVTRINGNWQVVKMAFGSKAHDILGHEAVMMRKLRAHPYIPDMLSYAHDKHVAELHMAWQNGKPWSSKDLSLILNLLNSWRTAQNRKPLGDYQEWTHIKAELSKHKIWANRVHDWEEWEFTPFIRHGDLTRPNLRRGDSGELWVHDWERGSLSGLPGLDLAHYLIQDTLFRGQSPISSLKTVISRMSDETVLNWMRDIGWRGGIIPLLASTIAYNTDRQFFDNADLLNALGEICA